MEQAASYFTCQYTCQCFACRDPSVRKQQLVPGKRRCVKVLLLFYVNTVLELGVG